MLRPKIHEVLEENSKETVIFDCFFSKKMTLRLRLKVNLYNICNFKLHYTKDIGEKKGENMIFERFMGTK